MKEFGLIMLAVMMLSVQEMKCAVAKDTTKMSVTEELRRSDEREGVRVKYTLKHPMYGWDNQNFAYCYWDNKTVYNLRSYAYYALEDVLCAKVSPASFAYVAMCKEKKEKRMAMYSTNEKECFHKFKFKDMGDPVDFRFTADARRLVVTFDTRQLGVFNMEDFKMERKMSMPIHPESWLISPNQFFIVFASGSYVYVYNFETGEKREIIVDRLKVHSVTFTPDSKKMGVLRDEGRLDIYDTRTFKKVMSIDRLGEARECCFHPDGKYVSVVTSGREITTVNMKDTEDRIVVETESGGICHISGATSLDGLFYLLFNEGKNMHFYRIPGLTPNYQKIVTTFADSEMGRWQKQQKGESTEDYHQRVNEETRGAKYDELKSEMATKLAGDRVEKAKVSIGSYDPKQRVMEIRFDNLPPIYIDVKRDEAAQIGDGDGLIFANSRYTVDEKDNFELLYTEVTNKNNGRSYVYDKKKGRSEVVEDDDEEEDFVPLDIIRRSSEEEARLEQIKDSVVRDIMSMNMISDKTHISVKTNVEPSVNAEGRKTLDYSVDFSYYVEMEYTTRDDYKPGQYECTQSEAAMAMLKCVTEAFSEHFEQYLAQGKKVLITLYGSADAMQINRVIPYDGRYGEFRNSLVYNKGELGPMTVTIDGGVTTNEQLAFMRAVSVKNYVERNIKGLGGMRRDYTYNIAVSDEMGAEYRRIGVRFTFMDTFK